MVYRVFVEKKAGFDVEAQQLLAELRDILGIDRLERLRIINRYDVEGIGQRLFEDCIPTVFSEPQVDIAYRDITAEIEGCAAAFPVEYLPGQFDQRADSASECIQLISQGERPTVRSAKVYVLYGVLRRADLPAIMDYVINPVEARAALMDLPETLAMDYEEPADVEVLEGFNELDEAALANFIDERGLAMDLADITLFQEYFRTEGRAPTITEVKMVDTYWSDHCRHTTFGTELTSVQIDDAVVREAFDRYLDMRRELGRENKPICLMDMGTIGAKYLKAKGVLTGLDESDEINACTVKVKVDVDGTDEDWLFLFKNETHNHPTEIEPFGGAATCVGGAIRDPLSGRSYVYQAMRVTGASNPLVPVSETIPGKLPQRKLVTTAAAGYSSYGNQIGLATGIVDELYHPGYAAKRMEIGAVLGATPASHVRREEPAPGDVVVLLGGRTGRDGIGGATGSSKAHKASSLETCGAEVQKGNPPVERKIQRLFRRGDACRLIKRCNDFGAGGVSVAIGELADGLFVELDKVPKKYDGLDGTELAISESQERMAVALAPEDVEEFLAYAREENLEATPVATVTDDARVRMTWRGQTIVDVSREFLASNGAPKSQDVHVVAPGVSGAPTETGAPLLSGSESATADSETASCAALLHASNENASRSFRNGVQTVPVGAPDAPSAGGGLAEPAGEVGAEGASGKVVPAVFAHLRPADIQPDRRSRFAMQLHALVSDINNCSRKGLVERFDSTIGAGTVLMPFGGKTQLTPAKAMVAKFPVHGETTSVSGMAWGFNPYLSSADPFTGSYLAVVESVAKLIATGFARSTMYLTLQEYFEKLRDVPERWGKPTAAVLGALMAQVDLGVGAIGGKDSMSGSFEDLDVPPTLVSFAVGTGHTADIVSPEFKQAGSRVVLVAPRYIAGTMRPQAESIVETFDAVQELLASGHVLAASTCGHAGSAQELFEMCVGNRIGLNLDKIADPEQLFAPAYGSFMLELAADVTLPQVGEGVCLEEIGTTTSDYVWHVTGETIDLVELQEVWESTLEPVFPYREKGDVLKPVPAFEGTPSASAAFARTESEPSSPSALQDDAQAAALNADDLEAEDQGYAAAAIAHSAIPRTPRIAKPKVIIPVFPGNNCEYDSAAAFERAGAAAETFIVNNLSPAAVAQSTTELANRIRVSQILMIPGGFSGGDEPDGSAKFITSFFRAPEVTEAVRELLANDGLILGICNGFQALVKLGLVPFGDIRDMDAECPTLTFNTLGRHQSKIVRTRVGSTLSPWLSKCHVGDVHSVPISHGEGRFVAPEKLLYSMAQAGQIAFQYVDEAGNPSMDLDANPNGSIWAIEGITSPDGRVLGKMGHTERAGAALYKNIPDYTYQPLIEGGVAYFA